MADMENQEDQKISECLQEAFGYSDEQLLKKLDHVNENFKDVSFAGAEDRLMKRFMERKAEMERKAAEAAPETTKSDAQAGAIPEITAEAEDCASGEESKTEPLELEKRQGEKQNKKKIVRFGKKKALATAALVAVIAGMLGGTAIGKKNYFFQKSEATMPRFVLDNAKNKVQSSKIESVYQEIEKVMDVKPLKLGYYPSNLEFIDAEVTVNKAKLRFSYDGQIIVFIQEKKLKDTSMVLESDRMNEYEIYNEWIKQNVEYSSNILQDAQEEFEMLTTIDNIYYYFAGIMPHEEYEKILKNLNFF